MKTAIITTAAAFCILASSAQAKTSAADLVAPITQYKLYVIDEVDLYVEKTKLFTDAVIAGNLAQAKKLYAPARVHYERIEPVAELFSDLDAQMDAREESYAQGSSDPSFTGYHRIEKALWEGNTTNGMKKYAVQLQADAVELQKRLIELTFPPKDVVGGAAVLIEEVASSKISGEENRYALTDLSDFQANIDGSKKIVSLLQSLLEQEAPALTKKVQKNFDRVEVVLAKYRTADGFKSYDKLTDKDRLALKGPITVLAEELAKLRGVLNLD